MTSLLRLFPLVLALASAALSGCAATDRAGAAGPGTDRAPIGMPLGDLNHRYPMSRDH